LGLLTVADADVLTMEVVESLVDWDKAAEMDRLDVTPRRESAKLRRPENVLPSYEWRWDRDCLGDVWALVEIGIDEVTPAEQEWEHALRYETTQQYITWYKQGYLPPPISVVRHKQGHLVSLNRRRWLAAREAGVSKLLAWYSPTRDGSPQWQRRLCRQHLGAGELICTRYAEGLSCVGCEHFRA
jgi:hypothetical protein